MPYSTGILISPLLTEQSGAAKAFTTRAATEPGGGCAATGAGFFGTGAGVGACVLPIVTIVAGGARFAAGTLVCGDGVDDVEEPYQEGPVPRALKDTPPSGDASLAESSGSVVVEKCGGVEVGVTGSWVVDTNRGRARVLVVSMEPKRNVAVGYLMMSVG